MIQIQLMEPFDLGTIFNCGQAFRWTRMTIEGGGQQSYIGIVQGQLTRVTQEQQHLKIECVGLAKGHTELSETFWVNYFDLQRSYETIALTLLRNNPELSDAIAFGRGLRILNQDPFEMLVTFIVSANNNIPRIEKSIQLLSKSFGEWIEPISERAEVPSGQDLSNYFAFPTALQLASASLESVRACGVGYRDRYLIEASKQWIEAGGDGFGSQLSQMPHEEAKRRLMAFTGVGAKVADCILLFCAEQHDAFPVDTWMSKALNRYYGDDLGTASTPQTLNGLINNRFGALKGFAQQYIFHYERNGKMPD